jgi:hypothetical protein
MPSSRTAARSSPPVRDLTSAGSLYDRRMDEISANLDGLPAK